MDQQQICTAAAQGLLVACGAGFSLLLLTWRFWRMNRYLKEVLERELRTNTARERLLLIDSSKRFASTTQSLLRSFLQEPVPSLKDLVERTELEYRLRASERRSEENADTIELTTRDFTPR